MNKNDSRLWNKVYDVLVELGGAQNYYRNEFLAYMTSGGHPFKNSYEYRFQGVFGFGGKLRYNGEKLYVDYYEEDKTKDRESSLIKINQQLNDLFEKYLTTINHTLNHIVPFIDF